VGFVDLDGVMRGKYMARDKFFACLESGVKFCDVVFGWDSNDQLYDASTFTGWHTAFPDATMRIDPTTCRNVSGEGDMLFFLDEFEDEAAALCYHRLLWRIIERAAAMELKASATAELQIYVFDERRIASATRNTATSRI
jgi:glutamine synthetase